MFTLVNSYKLPHKSDKISDDHTLRPVCISHTNQCVMQPFWNLKSSHSTAKLELKARLHCGDVRCDFHLSAWMRLGREDQRQLGKWQTLSISNSCQGCQGTHRFQLTKGSCPSTILTLEGNRVNVYWGSHWGSHQLWGEGTSELSSIGPRCDFSQCLQQASSGETSSFHTRAGEKGPEVGTQRCYSYTGKTQDRLSQTLTAKRYLNSYLMFN